VLPAVLATVESTRWRRCSGRGVVWSSGVLRWPSPTLIASVVFPRREGASQGGGVTSTAAMRPRWLCHVRACGCGVRPCVLACVLVSRGLRRRSQRREAHRKCCGRWDGGAMMSCGHVAPKAVQRGVVALSPTPATPAASHGFGTPPSSSSSPSALLAWVGCGRPPRWRRGDGTSARALGLGLL